jgi:hypothetical protein
MIVCHNTCQACMRSRGIRKFGCGVCGCEWWLSTSAMQLPQPGSAQPWWRQLGDAAVDTLYHWRLLLACVMCKGWARILYFCTAFGSNHTAWIETNLGSAAMRALNAPVCFLHQPYDRACACIQVNMCASAAPQAVLVSFSHKKWHRPVTCMTGIMLYACVL